MPYNNLRSLPVYQKALELVSTSRAVASYFAYNQDLSKLYKSSSLRDCIADSLLTDAILIPQQIAKANESKSHAVRMRSASLINIMIRNILSYCNGLERDGVKETEFLNLMREEINSFRKDFKRWRKSIGYNSNDSSWDIIDPA